MKYFDNDNVVWFDVDETLVLYKGDHHKPQEGLLEFIDPYTEKQLYLQPHKEHAYLMEQYKGRGYTVGVWSANGGRWAKHVVDRLQLGGFVDIVMSKPTKHVDDKKDLNDIVGSRVYIDEREF